MEVRIAGSITEIAKTRWDNISGNNVMSSYGWLKTIEESFIEKIIPQIIFITDSKGIVGASACYIFGKGRVFGQKILAKSIFPLRGMWIKKMLPAKIRESLTKKIENTPACIIS